MVSDFDRWRSSSERDDLMGVGYGCEQALLLIVGERSEAWRTCLGSFGIEEGEA